MFGYKKVKPWPHRASSSVSALMLASMLENGYEADAWCGLYRYKSMWAITSVNADADADADSRCGQGLTRKNKVIERPY